MVDKQRWLDKPNNVKKVLLFLYMICALLLSADLIYHRHTLLSVENLFGFYGIYGFVACVLLVLVAKEMRKIVARPENYYGDKNDR